MERRTTPKGNIQARILVQKLQSPSHAGECEFGYSLVCCDGIWQFELGYHAATNSPNNKGFDYFYISDEIWKKSPYEALCELVIKNAGHHPDIKGRGTCVEWEKLEQLFETKKKQAVLREFEEKGFLMPVYSDLDLSVYIFLDRVCVAFDSSGTEGLLLTRSEMELMIHSGWDNAFQTMRNSSANAVLEFSPSLLNKCDNPLGRMSVRRMLCKRGYKKCMLSVQDLSPYRKLHGHIVRSVLSSYIPSKNSHFDLWKKSRRRLKIIVTVSMVFFFASMVSLCTNDLREQWNPLKTPVVYESDTEVGTYCSIEVDFLAEYRYYYNTNTEYSKGSPYGTYYLFGNSKTGQYGILKFDSSFEQGDLFDDYERVEILEESITLYGTVKNLMSRISEPRPTEPSTNPIMGTMPGGWPLPQLPTVATMPIILMPGEMYADYSENAWDLFSQYVFDVENDLPVGAIYLDASVHQQKEELTVNRWIDAMFFAGLFGFFVSWIFAFPAANKVDQTNKSWRSVQSGELLNRCLAVHQPVQLVGQSICINNGALITLLMAMRTISYELNGVIHLQQREPVIEVHEDGEKTVAYCLQCEPDENFENKYFQISVRLGLSGVPMIPILQVDGFISDTSQDRKMEFGDVGYRMEGHYLACGKEEAKMRYEKMRGMDLVAKGLKYPGMTTPASVRLVGICPECKKSFAFHGYAFYMMQGDVAYSDDGLDVCVINEYNIDKEAWSYEEDGKTFRYYNSFNCPHCRTPYIDYKEHPDMKTFGVSGCVHIGRKHYG